MTDFTAKQARELGQDLTRTADQAAIDKALRAIRNAAERELTSVCISADRSGVVVLRLEALGYKVQYIEPLNHLDPPELKVSW